VTDARRIFLAGATGVIGIRLVPLLVAAGHTVAGMTRTPAKSDTLRALGAAPVIADAFDAEGLQAALDGFRPDTIVSQLTDLPDERALVVERAAANARIRREGTHNLIAAARAAGVSRFLAQSVAWELDGDGGAAVADLEAAVLANDGVVLRYGQFYGFGTYHDSGPPPHPRVQIDDAARRTVPVLDAAPGVVWIVDPT